VAARPVMAAAVVASSSWRRDQRVWGTGLIIG